RQMLMLLIVVPELEDHEVVAARSIEHRRPQALQAMGLGARAVLGLIVHMDRRRGTVVGPAAAGGPRSPEMGSPPAPRIGGRHIGSDRGVPREHHAASTLSRAHLCHPPGPGPDPGAGCRWWGPRQAAPRPPRRSRRGPGSRRARARPA